MQQTTSTVDQIDEYFRGMNEEFLTEKETFTQLYQELTSVNKSVSNKEIIAGLIQKLETEQDVTKSDIYRKTLEIILQAAPDA